MRFRCGLKHRDIYLQYERFVVSGAPTARLALRRLFSFLVRQSGSNEVHLDKRAKHTSRRPYQRVSSNHCRKAKQLGVNLWCYAQDIKMNYYQKRLFWTTTLIKQVFKIQHVFSYARDPSTIDIEQTTITSSR